MWRNKCETVRKIKLIDVLGGRRTIRKRGRLNVTKHDQVISALKNRRFSSQDRLNREDIQDQALFDAAIDETRTVTTVGESDSDSETSESDFLSDIRLTEIELQELAEVRDIQEYLLQVHGTPPGKKQDGVVRLIYENLNGLNSRLSGNEKLDKAKEIIDELGADVVAYNELRLNWKHKDNKNGMRELFKGGETEIRAVAANNVHENVGRTQEGGTALMAYGDLVAYLDPDETGKDETGLGRWTYMRFVGADGKSTYVVSGYNPCSNKKVDSGTTYQQHRRYLIEKENDLTCPRKRFREDLVRKLKEWRKEGNRLIVCLDANEDIYLESIGRELSNLTGLGLQEVVSQFTGKRLGATFFRGSKPIDGVWATGDLEVVNACVMPVGYGVGDHRLFVVDFTIESMVGDTPQRICRPGLRRLNTRIEGCSERYIRNLEKNIKRHNLLGRLEAISSSGLSDAEQKSAVDKLDNERRQYMRRAEKKCRKLKSGRIPFSPEASVWIKRTQIYRTLLRYHAGKRCNRGNLKRAARRCNITAPFSLSLQEIRARLSTCKEQCSYFRRHGARYRRRHLYKCLEGAQDRQDEEAEKKILAIISREKDKAFWRKLNYSLGKKKKGRSVGAIQRESEDGGIEDIEGQRAVEEAIFDEVHRKRYFLAEDAPICKGKLRGDFGYTATSPTARAVLDGTYEYPESFDEPTKALLKECARIRQLIPRNQVSSNIGTEEWQRRWRKAKEDTSSSPSLLHFSHYKAGADSDIISSLHAALTSIAFTKGFALERWSNGLCVMLEKMFGCRLVSKLRAILLMEADFNTANKEIFGNRMLETARQNNLMPEEIFSERGRMATDGALAKVLFYDISRQMKKAAGIASVDASNCYDRIAHAIASLVFQAFGVSAETSTAMLQAIEEMKFFLRTAYGDSKAFAGSTIEVKTQGLCQGNGAAPAGWCVISITILQAHKRKGHGAHFACPISSANLNLAAILYVDDTDLLCINLSKEQSITEVQEDLQEAIMSWGKLLIATGGTLKPPKCFAHLISYDWRPDGTWRYAAWENDEDMALGVPLPDGSIAEIELLSVDSAKKTLGVVTCPSGESKGSISQMQAKGKEWVESAKNGKMNRRFVWFSIERQLWPSVGYGLCSNTGSLRELTESMQPIYYEVLPLGGVVRKAPSELRMLDIGFYGIGCPHPGIEATVQQSNKLLMHHGCKSALGVQIQISLEQLILELGMSFQPFQMSFRKYGTWVTKCWLKGIWEKMDAFDFRLEVNNVPLQFSREGDEWIMRIFEECGYSMGELRRLNRVRIHQQVLFWSDVVSANGKTLEPQYQTRRPLDEKWSTLDFPTQQPPRRDFKLWREALTQARSRQLDRLGRFVVPGHRVWPWRYCEASDTLIRDKGQVMDVYVKSELPGHRRANRYTRQIYDAPRLDGGVRCSVEEVAPAVVAIRSRADPIRKTEPPNGFLDVLREWGCLWMWESLELEGDDGWIAEAIADETLMAVSDGSYIKEIYPHLCSAAFILECTRGRGRLIGSFPEKTLAANAYRGELLGLMAIHLILLSVNRVDPDLQGSVHIYSDCLGALHRVRELPPHRIPSRCRHSDILKNLLVNCSSYSFERYFSHVKAHQDDHDDISNLEQRQAQLNCMCDTGAKSEIQTADLQDLPKQRAFPLEPICLFVGDEKMTSDTGEHIRYSAHKTLAKEVFHSLKILTAEQFDEVDWQHVHLALHSVPRLFQTWACKQVTGIAATNLQMSYRDGRDAICPCCTEEIETTSHILHCDESGRVEALLATADELSNWLDEVNTDPDIADCIVEYVKGRGGKTMRDIEADLELPPEFKEVAVSQDKIGWQRMLEGMISKEFVRLQQYYWAEAGIRASADKWASGLVTRLLEITHGQWIYRNFVVHDRVSGTLATAKKEELQREIERQQDLGATELLEEDKYLLEVNLEDLERSSGERQEYWLLAIQAARRAYQLVGTQGNARSNRESHGRAYD